MAEEIFREQTTDEKKDFVNILKKDKELDAYQRFKKTAEAKEAASFKKYQPYCFRCARLDFLKKKKEIEEEAQLNLNDDVKIDANFDYEQYGDIKRFKEVKRSEVFAQDKRYAVPIQVVIAHNISYTCKVRGCGITIHKPVDAKDAAKVEPIPGQK